MKSKKILYFLLSARLLRSKGVVEYVRAADDCQSLTMLNFGWLVS